ncbi:methionyl-tRNA formyltransferase [Platysternon megacephalum]|uniref:Methionyl-tRNA formyltransferase n=1 Tax=Platysternon megacephalum TaxID=55544 RepID=A0A4D9DJS5_9SAUR|nr:methionyl-tRNA formyltransferase [Platysternon megacephalum]
MAAEQEMRDFTRGLFQGSPDLSVLTLTMVRRRYLAHAGRESLVPEEKELLKQLVEEELLRMQLDDSSSDGGSPSPESARDAPGARAEKRPHSGSDSSRGGPEDTARKKQRLDQGSEASSDGEDSGIDSRKPKPAPAQEDAGKSGHTGSCEDEGDSGAEETPDRGGIGRESDSEWAAGSEGTKQPPRRRTEGAREAKRRGDCGEANGGITAQKEVESGSESAVVEEECKWQKQTGKMGARKTKRRSDSEEEGDSKKKGRMRARGKEVGSDSEVNEKECQSRKGARKKGLRKAGRWSDSEEEENKEKRTKAQREESGSESEEEEGGRSRKPAGKKGTKKAEQRSDSEAEEVGSRKKRTKAQKWKESGSESEEEEEGRSRTPGTKKAERREVELERKKRRTKAQSEEESGSEEEEGESRKETGKKGRRKAERGSEEEEGKVQARQRGSSETDEDSSSSSSAQDENNSPNPGSRRKKGKAPGSGGAGPAEEHPAVRRLKRYILACGVRRNYRKLLAGCRSVKQRVGVLRRELEAIGLQGEWGGLGRGSPPGNPPSPQGTPLWSGAGSCGCAGRRRLRSQRWTWGTSSPRTAAPGAGTSGACTAPPRLPPQLPTGAPRPGAQWTGPASAG